MVPYPPTISYFKGPNPVKGVISALHNCLRLGRIGMAPLTISIPILAAYTAVDTLPFAYILLLGVLGLCAHLFGFGLNDIIDYPLDRHVAYRQHSPLVSGQITLLQACSFVLIQPLLVLLIYLVLLRGSLVGLLLLAVSLALSVSYNLWSKRGRLPRLFAEITLAAAVGTLSLAAVLVFVETPPLPSLLFAGTLALILLLVNSVCSGLKDLKSDAELGARSFVLSTGTRVVGTDQVLISPVLWGYTIILQVLVAASLLILSHVGQLVWYQTLLITTLLFWGGLHLGYLLRARSFHSLRRRGPLLNGYYNFFALVIFVMPQLPPLLQLGYGLVLCALLAAPWRMAYRTWKKRRFGLV